VFAEKEKELCLVVRKVRTESMEVVIMVTEKEEKEGKIER
jgi:hypothetical protein